MTLAQQSFGRRLCGTMLVFLSLGAFVLSLGAPGLGWLLSGAILIVAGACRPLIGRGWLLACLTSTFVLLFTFGPLASQVASSPAHDWRMMAFTFGPLAIGLGALFLPSSRRMRASQ